MLIPIDWTIVFCFIWGAVGYILVDFCLEYYFKVNTLMAMIAGLFIPASIVIVLALLGVIH